MSVSKSTVVLVARQYMQTQGAKQGDQAGQETRGTEKKGSIKGAGRRHSHAPLSSDAFDMYVNVCMYIQIYCIHCTLYCTVQLVLLNLNIGRKHGK